MAERPSTSRAAPLTLLGLSAFALAMVSSGARAQGTPSAKAIPAQQEPAASRPGSSVQPSATPASADRPLPDIRRLMLDVEANQRRSEAIEKDYLYRSVVRRQEADGQGQTKKTTVEEYDVYWLSGVHVSRMMKKNGKDLTAEEIAKENERIDKETAKARERRAEADAQGKETDSHGEEEIAVSRLLELGSFSNARRVQLNGRDTIAVDYAGDPQAKTRNRAEEAIRDIQGTAWVDEQDRVLARAEGHFVNAYKIGAGLIVDIRKDTSFSMEQTKVNGEVWLPARVDAKGAIRSLLFFSFSGSVHAADSDYRKFKATSTVLPGITPVEAPGGSDSGAPAETTPRP